MSYLNPIVGRCINIPIKIIIAGSRDFNDYEFVKSTFLDYTQYFDDNLFEIVSGTARGADKLGERLGEELGIPISRFPADWTIGKQAGYLRNSQMADYADVLLAYWDGKSRGTKHMIDLAEKKGLSVHIYKYEVGD